MISKATVVGTGAMGTVMAQVLAHNQVHVALLGRRSGLVDRIQTTRVNRDYLPDVHLNDHIVATVDARPALANTELVIAAVPCQHLRERWRQIAEFIPHESPVCSVVKGLEIRSRMRSSQILRELSPRNSLSVLSGPSIAPEIARCLPATVVVASEDQRLAALVQEVLSTSWFRIYTNADVVGVELAGAVKNVIAIAAGILDGLRAGNNAKAALLTRGLTEISRLGAALGAAPETYMGLAGVGDLVTTCVSPLGRNRSAGEKIGRGKTAQEVIESSSSVIEGIPTTRAVLALAREFGVDMPITQAVSDVLFDEKPPLTALTELMNRPLKAEQA